MNILELEQYNLEDAVKFHDQLNPRIWDERENMRPEVREKLLTIADDFREFLGVQDLDLQDITLSGSNAAYTYTPHSDIDLHLVVAMPPDEVYQELFKAKKYQYNQEHNIRIGGYDVELYVQDAEQPHHSQGIYSIMNDKWLSVPRRQRATIDDDGVRNKYEDLTQRIDSVIASEDHDEISKLISKIKNMRAAGLETQGEFGVDNLVFKMLRSQGFIKRLADARTQARDRELSLLERGRRKKTKPRTRYAWGGWWYPGFGYGDSGDSGGDGGGDGGGGESMREQSNPHGLSPETSLFIEQQHNRDIEIITQFQKFAANHLGIEDLPQLIIHRNKQWQTDNGSFGRYDDGERVMHLAIADRHIMDVLRTLAHELVHYRQDLNHELSDHSGATGSPQENEANAEAGKIMRNFAKTFPEIFSESITAPKAAERSKDRFYEMAGVGVIAKKGQEKDPRYSMSITADVKPGQVGKEANKMGLETDSQGRPKLLMRSANLRESLTLEQRLRMAIENGGGSDDERLGNQEPTGPESPPKFPAGTTKIDVKDLTDWYRLGMNISDLDDADPADFGQGPPQTVVVFPSDEFEQPYLKQFKRLGLKTHDIDEDRVQQGRQDLVIFDIDDTLMHTTAKIRVIKNGKVVRELSNQEFNSYELAPGEKFDFGEFRSAAKFRQESQPIEPMVRKLKTILAYHPKAQVIMLTARADFDNKKMFLQTFSDLGIDMSRVHVHRAGNLPGDAIPAEKKAVWVRRYLDSGRYDHVRLYDDSMSNLTVFKSLAQEYPDVDFRAIYVGPGGTTRTVEDKHSEPGSAGCVLLAEDTGRWGLQRRSDRVNDSGLWACWGGGRDPGESLEQTVRRELAEESGYTGDLTLVPLHKNSRYATYIGIVPQEFKPRINHESDAWCWRAFDSWPEPLHPGLAAVRELMIEQPHSDMITDSELPDLPFEEDNTREHNRVIFIGDNVAIVGQEHGKPLQLSDKDAERVQAITRRHGAWYEGNGMDRELTKGIIDRYQGSWDDNLLSPSVKGYPAQFLYVLFSNIEENDTVEGKIGSDPKSTIFDRILDTQPSTNYFPDRRFDAETLTKFLRSVSEGPYDFVEMSQAPATERNVRRFFKMGERLMWPDNWAEYPYRAGRVAKSVNDLRDKFLASRKQGVYVTGSDHLRAVQQLLDQPVSENFADGKKPGRKGLAKRVGVNCKQSVSKLRSIAKNSSGERQRMAHWCANMKSGKSK